MLDIYVEFDCPFCGKEIRLIATELGPDKLIKCFCGEIIPAGALYDNTTAD